MAATTRAGRRLFRRDGSSVGVAAVGGGRHQGQHDDEAGIAGPGFDPDIALVLLDDDAPRQIQAEPGALAERLGGEERR